MDYSIPYLLTLPDSLLLEEIFPQLPLRYLSRLCSVNKRFYNICLNDRLWKLRTYYQYPDVFDQKPINISWRQYYTYLINYIGEIDVIHFGHDNLGKIELSRKSTIESLTDQILNLAQQKGYSTDDYIIEFYQQLPNFIYIAPLVRTQFINIGRSTPNNIEISGLIEDINTAQLITDANEIANIRRYIG